MILSHIVIDNFFEGLSELTEFASKLEMIEEVDVFAYQGLRSIKALNLTGIDRRISESVHEKLKTAPQFGHGIVRASGGKRERTTHAYLNSGHWVGILNLKVHENAGLQFLEHSPTKTENVMLNEVNFKKIGVNSVNAAKDEFSKIISQDCGRADKWKQSLFIPSKLNRLTLFRPWAWHCPSHGFSGGSVTERLDYYIVLERA